MKYYLAIGNQDWLSEDLEELEEILYKHWYIGETSGSEPLTLEEFRNSRERELTEKLGCSSNYIYCYIYTPEYDDNNIYYSGMIEIAEGPSDEEIDLLAKEINNDAVANELYKQLVYACEHLEYDPEDFIVSFEVAAAHTKYDK